MSPITFKQLNDWLHWLETTRPETNIELGLTRIHKVLDNARLLKPAPFVITVAGTNGKGSTVALLESILTGAGYTVGAYTSPHIHRFNERIRINGVEVSDQSLCGAFCEIDRHREDNWLSYFEFAVAVAAHCFQKANVEIAIMEVGLGGRLDATNAIEPDLSIITTVDLDHQDWLGETIEEIAREKAGIMRPGVPAIYGDSFIPETIIEQAVAVEAPLYRRGVEFNITVEKTNWNWQGKNCQGLEKNVQKLPIPQLVIDNAATVVQAVKLLPYPVSYDQLVTGIARARLSGRYTKVVVENKNSDPVEVVFDVAHNPQAARKLRERLEQDPVPGKTRALIAMYRDKDYKSVVDVLAPVIDEWYVSEFDSPRALAASDLKDVVEDCGGSVGAFSQIDDIIDSASSDDRLLVVGSFMTVARYQLDNKFSAMLSPSTVSSEK
ncbi:bifunctional tetrahydrofolate synthase/dihydrofolate synthase [Endozoicomonas euniceicola]|uniref:Dihydrofolate synthase/folylpolyglutamate synthase n=1 Tax=Endozoicomonas euniceicola TaxID=1234143 RepID=A0ABY6GUI0_9GAMM|nr:bifunctional tetrahydrofolate synthase/dihydrofolate synthase [Endozoicomonas euniceicola]UYM16433.1 bifunctional tetrahydrofolate synthase/dihydrofolate synthase [Endozoicomonas euniceicola]